jgi:uncharacterized membrane protein YdcZ (DUF606 family)
MENYQKIMVIIIYLIVLFVFIHTYIYLNQLTTCECFLKNNKYSVNIEFMKFFQILEIFIFTIYIGFMLFLTSTLNKQNTSSPKILASISLALLVGISGYMAYNVINLYMNISDDCKCATSAYRYFLYYQGVVGASTVLRFISLFLMIGLALLFNHRIAI